MSETIIEYMKRRLAEYRLMQPTIILPLQTDYPNCNKYTKCCTNLSVEEKRKLETLLQYKSLDMPNIHTAQTSQLAVKPKDFEDINVSEL